MNCYFCPRITTGGIVLSRRTAAAQTELAAACERHVPELWTLEAFRNGMKPRSDSLKRHAQRAGRMAGYVGVVSSR